MKEIDFLPDWYKHQRNQQISYRTKYVVLGGVFFVIMTLNFTSSFTIFRMKSLIAKTEPQIAAAQQISNEYTNLKSQMEEIKKKEELLKKLDSKINVPSVLAEISYLVDDKIVLEKLELTAEKFDDQALKIKKNKIPAVVRTAVVNTTQTEDLYPNVRFKIFITGIAAGGSDVARLVCKLEDSDYFTNVILVGSKPKDRKIISSNNEEENCQVNEFEINCYLANYEYNDANGLPSLQSTINGRIR